MTEFLNRERSEIAESARSSLVSRNITILGRRTSVRLEPQMWMALNEIAEREKCTVHEICTLIFIRRSKKTTLTAAIRVFLMLYFKSASTEEGHKNAGHGNFDNMLCRARIPSDYKSFFRVRPNTGPAHEEKADAA